MNLFIKIAPSLIGCLLTFGARADTMDHYMNIVNNIPKMEVKADNQAQVWARSARNVLLLTCESVAESLTVANTIAAQRGAPLFCIPANVNFDGALLHNLVQQTYRELSSRESDKAKMTVSEVALAGLTKTYPCQNLGSQRPKIYIKSVKRKSPVTAIASTLAKGMY